MREIHPASKLGGRDTRQTQKQFPERHDCASTLGYPAYSRRDRNQYLQMQEADIPLTVMLKNLVWIL